MADLTQKFKLAVADAKIANQDEIYKNLTSITDENKNLILDDANRILVLNFTSYDGYDSEIGNVVPLRREVWVTIAPELENFCKKQKLNFKDMTVRLEQLLGLPAEPFANKRFVSMWVSPNDLFRPCPDPEINDSECELDYPSSPYTTLSPEYINWFETQKSISYLENGYPWTRLGYTYDWGGQNKVGLSEFIIKSGANIKIENVLQAEEYIAKKCDAKN